jgi:ABC-type uncharacterized transport system fused permease/ATPase subunit
LRKINSLAGQTGQNAVFTALPSLTGGKGNAGTDMEAVDETPDHRRLWSRFWQSASGLWRGRSAWLAWTLSGSLVATVLCQLYVQYQLNYWNRDFFDALERRDAHGLRLAVLMFVPLAGASTALAIFSVWGRMTTQRKWREWLTTHVIGYWLEDDRYRRLAQLAGEPRIPEYRIAEDARVATDAPIDFALGLLQSLLTASVFIQVLWSVGGDITVAAFGMRIWIPGYLVVSVVVYSGIVTGAMMVVGRALTTVVQRKNQSEAELITAAHMLRELGEAAAPARRDVKERDALWAALRSVLAQWLKLCWQLMGTTLVSHANFLLAPVMGLMLCAPKFLAGTMTLGELTQAAAAFTLVQSAFNWLVDNYQRVADWLSSVDRVALLLIAIDEFNHSAHAAGSGESGLAERAVEQA